jgi:uroporphyrin-III C-methyltransferase
MSLAKLLASRPRLAPGEVWLAGAGPGDPGCLTLDVADALGQADVVVHDALVAEAVLDLAAPGAELRFVGKRGGLPSARQTDINALLVSLARAGRRVLRLKGGDPFIFGRGGEEALALREAGIPFRVLPGVTAGIGGLAAAGIPATMRRMNHAVILATGHDAGEDGGLDWRALARTGQPIVLYMASRTLPAIVAELLAGGLPGETPAAIVVSATLPGQRVLVATLATLVEQAQRGGFGAPAVIAIGAIVTMREQLSALAAAACA